RARVVLDRPDTANDVQPGFGASRERSRRREEVPSEEKATRRLSSDLHRRDINRASVDRLAKWNPATLGWAAVASSDSVWVRSYAAARSKETDPLTLPPLSRPRPEGDPRRGGPRRSRRHGRPTPPLPHSRTGSR